MSLANRYQDVFGLVRYSVTLYKHIHTRSYLNLFLSNKCLTATFFGANVVHNSELGRSISNSYAVA